MVFWPIRQPQKAEVYENLRIKVVCGVIKIQRVPIQVWFNLEQLIVTVQETRQFGSRRLGVRVGISEVRQTYFSYYNHTYEAAYLLDYCFLHSQI